MNTILLGIALVGILALVVFGVVLLTWVEMRKVHRGQVDTKSKAQERDHGV